MAGMSAQSMGTGAASGATMGAAFGPIGALVGAGIGAGASYADSSSQEKDQEKNQERAAEGTLGVKRRRLKKVSDALFQAQMTKLQSMAGLSQAAMQWAQMVR